MGDEQGKKKETHLITNIVRLMIIAVAIVSLVLTAISITQLRTVYYKNIYSELKAVSYEVGEQMKNSDEGDWTTNDDGTVSKGGQNVTDQYMQSMDNLKKETMLDFSIIIDGKHAITTLKDGPERYNGSVSAKVKPDVEKYGYYFQRDMKVGPLNYCAYYRALENGDGQTVGYIFAGKETDAANKEMKGVVALMIIIAIAFIAAIIVIGLL